jgi:hypothetical protein
MIKLIEKYKDTLLYGIEKPYTDLEIQECEISNNIIFPEEYKSFLQYTSHAYCNSVGTFFLNDGTKVFGFSDFFSFENNFGNSWVNDMIEN